MEYPSSLLAVLRRMLSACSIYGRARTRTSGFRTRRLTPGGRHVLKNRRTKGRKVLAPGSYRK